MRSCVWGSKATYIGGGCRLFRAPQLVGTTTATPCTGLAPASGPGGLLRPSLPLPRAGRRPGFAEERVQGFRPWLGQIFDSGFSGGPLLFSRLVVQAQSLVWLSCPLHTPFIFLAPYVGPPWAASSRRQLVDQSRTISLGQEKQRSEPNTKCLVGNEPYGSVRTSGCGSLVRQN